MRLAFLTHEYEPKLGGISIRAQRIANGLQARGHEITVYTSAHPGRKKIDIINGVNVHRYNFLNPNLARFFKVPMRIMPGMFKLIEDKEIILKHAIR